ncbi:unnamed protein product [Miscanthus lutarioriparius]|uniref:Uncharacterized protein n=1 Tax=Miscanthus lutarioriparius TaxID=422564 RepID=A0A811Q680_9POAL|nr:unnamed protein product [Miscanthus lutarioriparius]
MARAWPPRPPRSGRGARARWLRPPQRVWGALAREPRRLLSHGVPSRRVLGPRLQGTCAASSRDLSTSSARLGGEGGAAACGCKAGTGTFSNLRGGDELSAVSPGAPPVPHVAGTPPTSSAERSRWQGEVLSATGTGLDRLHGACAAGPGNTRL